MSSAPLRRRQKFRPTSGFPYADNDLIRQQVAGPLEGGRRGQGGVDCFEVIELGNSSIEFVADGLLCEVFLHLVDLRL